MVTNKIKGDKKKNNDPLTSLLNSFAFFKLQFKLTRTFKQKTNSLLGPLSFHNAL